MTNARLRRRSHSRRALDCVHKLRICMIMPWRPSQLSLELATDASEGDIITARVGTPIGEILLMAEVDFEDTTLVLRAANIEGATANAVGIANLRAIVQLLLERMNCDEARIEGSDRTTGANPGHRPRVIRYARRAGPAA